MGDDPADLSSLRLRWKPGGDPAFAETFRRWWEAERGSRVAFVAYDEAGRPVGMANASIFTRMPLPGTPPARWLYAANVFVVPERRREGVGRALMRAIVGYARAEGMLRIVLAPSEMSVPFYASLGFRPAHDLARLDLDD